MRLSWNEIRARATQFAAEWANATYESGETQSFYNEFFEIFGVRRRTVARYEEHVRRLDNSHGFIDLFWPGVLLVEQKSAGRDLTAARKQAGTYFDALPERDRPRYQLLCDFQTFELLDRDEREETRFALADLPQHVEKFGFIIGVQRRTFRDQDPVNIEASERIARLHDALAVSGYDGHDLELFLVRMVFCLFADDTGIFEPRDIFLQFIEERTSPDGSDLGPYLARLFQVLNTPEERRQTKLDEDLARFPYVNGELFAEPLRIPDFDAEMRQSLLDACLFDWTAISPAIFGALFQSVMEPAERRAQGAHYTTEQNIRKVIEPLFLDDLRAEFVRLKTRRDNRRIPDLYTFQQKLGQLTFLDPACGCGNFLIIAYRELRQLEIEVLRELHPSGQLSAFAELLSSLAAITPYLFDGSGLANSHLVVGTESQPINGLAKLIIGSKPIDGGHYILDADELDALLAECPEAAPYVRPFIGAWEYLNGGERWILWLGEAPPDLLRQEPALHKRVRAVRAFRQQSKSPPTRKLAETPTLYHVNVIPDASFLVVPKVSSERRDYIPIAWLEPPTIPSDLVFVLNDATKPLFALLTSAMHMAWMRYFGGRLKSDYRYSIGVVYNTFPLPPVAEKDLKRLTPHADAVLAARANHPNATLADLYDPDAMPPNLRRAHSALDRAVDRLYRRARFTSERERVEHLFALYEQLQAPLAAEAEGKRKKRRVKKR